MTLRRKDATACPFTLVSLDALLGVALAFALTQMFSCLSTHMMKKYAWACACMSSLKCNNAEQKSIYFN